MLNPCSTSISSDMVSRLHNNLRVSTFCPVVHGGVEVYSLLIDELSYHICRVIKSARSHDVTELLKPAASRLSRLSDCCLVATEVALIWARKQEPREVTFRTCTRTQEFPFVDVVVPWRYDGIFMRSPNAMHQLG